MNDCGIRSRAITPAPELTGGAPLAKGQKIRIDLFPGVSFDATISESLLDVNGVVSTTARLDAFPWGRAFLAFSGGELLARIRVPEQHRLYAVNFNPRDRAHYALELDPRRAEPDEGPNDAIIPPADASDEPPLMLADESVATTVVDVLFAYSNDALTAAGSVANMNNTIAIGVAATNDAHANTNTGIVLNLVYSYNTNYTGSGDIGTDLSRVTNTSDGYMDEIHTHRNTYGADFCSLIVGAGSTSVGWLLTKSAGRPANAFTALTYNMVPGYSTAHEIGHNMGCHHAYDQDYQWGPTGDEIGTDAAGWHWHPTPGATGYCTVMTYTDKSYFDGVPPSGQPAPPAHACTDNLGHTRVGIFSDPNITDHGLPAGDVTNGNNARVLRTYKAVYAAYRSRPLSANSILVEYPNGGETLTAGNTYSIKWNSNGVSGNVKIELLKGGSLDRVVDASTLNDRIYAWTIPADVCGTGYRIRVSSVAAPAVLDTSDTDLSVNKAFYSEPMDANPSYTRSTTAWQFGVPSGDNPTYGGPASAYSGTNIYDTNLTGVTGSTTTLTTPAIDCSGYQSVRLAFMGWFSMYTGYRAKVSVSNDNTNWTDLYSRAGSFSSSSWSLYDYDISAVADGRATVYVRWSHINESGSGNFSGMSVDDVTLVGIATTPPPAAPTALTATAVSTTRINLAWTDNATNETGFSIERKTGAGGTFAEVATVGANVTIWSNTTGLSPDTTYVYRVRATNAGGNSAWSNEETTATAAQVPLPLAAGYTLIALPLEPLASLDAETLAVAINAAGGSCTAVIRYAGGQYETHPAGSSQAIFPVTPGNGYFVRCTASSTWTMTGLRFSAASAPLPLAAGYTLVGLPVEAPSKYTAESAAIEINAQGGSATQVLRYEGGEFKTHPAGSSQEIFPLSMGQGYFIRASATSTWTVSR